MFGLKKGGESSVCSNTVDRLLIFRAFYVNYLLPIIDSGFFKVAR